MEFGIIVDMPKEIKLSTTFSSSAFWKMILGKYNQKALILTLFNVFSRVKYSERPKKVFVANGPLISRL